MTSRPMLSAAIRASLSAPFCPPSITVDSLGSFSKRVMIGAIRIQSREPHTTTRISFSSSEIHDCKAGCTLTLALVPVDAVHRVAMFDPLGRYRPFCGVASKLPQDHLHEATPQK